LDISLRSVVCIHGSDVLITRGPGFFIPFLLAGKRLLLERGLYKLILLSTGLMPKVSRDEYLIPPVAAQLPQTNSITGKIQG
jgi:hypothetical protein